MTDSWTRRVLAGWAKLGLDNDDETSSCRGARITPVSMTRTVCRRNTAGSSPVESDGAAAVWWRWCGRVEVGGVAVECEGGSVEFLVGSSVGSKQRLSVSEKLLLRPSVPRIPVQPLC